MLVGHQIIKTSGLSANNKVNSSTHLGGVVIGNSNGAEAKKLNEINGIGLGFQGHGADVGLAGNGLEFQSQPNTFQGSRLPTSSFGPGAHNPSPLMMNMQDINTTHLLVEMEGNGKGRVSYVMILAWNAVDWQSNFVETVALSFWVSSLFTMVISTMALPIVLVLAAVFFHDKMDGMNILALFIAIWGFLSYIYQHYLDDLNPRQELMGLNYLMLLLTMVKIR
ncbi:hypothetical protein AAC387_Pa08g0187 [Persea americana]